MHACRHTITDRTTYLNILNRLHACVHACMHACMHACTHVWNDGWMDAWMDGWLAGWLAGLAGWVGGWVGWDGRNGWKDMHCVGGAGVFTASGDMP